MKISRPLCWTSFDEILKTAFSILKKKQSKEKTFLSKTCMFSSFSNSEANSSAFCRNIFSVKRECRFHVFRQWFRGNYSGEPKRGMLPRRAVGKYISLRQKMSSEAFPVFLKASGFDKLCVMEASQSSVRSLLSRSNKCFYSWDVLLVRASVWQFGKDCPWVR